MFKLFELIRKNLKLIVRSKTSSFIIFIGPLVLVLLLGLAYSQSATFSLKAAVYSESYSELSESLILKMTNQDFQVTKETGIDSCIGSVKRGDSQACIVFPPDMKVSTDTTNEITFYVDYSQINLVWMMLDVMSARVSERSGEISTELTGDLLDRVTFVEGRLNDIRAEADGLRSAGNGLKGNADIMKSGVTGLDISVDFSGLGVDAAKDSAGQIDALLGAIRLELSNMSSAVDTSASSIETSLASIEGDINDSSVLVDVDIIDDEISEIKDAVDDAVVGMDNSSSEAQDKIMAVKATLDQISSRLEETSKKITDVKSKRDDLLPQFSSIDSDVESVQSGVGRLQGMVDQGLQRISEQNIRDAGTISAPITTKIEPVTAQKTHFNSLFPTLLVLIIMITGILLSATLVIVEKRSKAFFRNNMTPTSYFTFSISTYLTTLMILFIQLMLFISISAFFFETEVLTSIWLLLLTVVLVCTVFICIGMFIGYLFRTEETVNLAAITVATILLLFSSAVIPLESLPAYFRDLAMFNPFVISELALKQHIIFQLGLDRTWKMLVWLGGISVAVFTLNIALQKVMRKIMFIQISGPAVKHEQPRKMKSRKKEEKKHDINELLVKK